MVDRREEAGRRILDSPDVELPDPAGLRVELDEVGGRRARWRSGASGAALVRRMAEVVDAHRWDGLSALLHPDFSCRYVHTGETFDRDAWVRLNAGYPGFDRFVLEDCVGDAGRAASRAHVTAVSDDEVHHFEVATFITAREGLIAEMTEVWTGVEQSAPEGARPG